ncbi:hypothetical protein E4U17_002473 [Claviceps sp. LM77 group G4]|nr:hypothetical protein E4U17_002473 [Claviceps sp. LM77 group G4]KAG6066135.1 hypothetical protein E4U33_005676 [Claviceps sp. LM78 group G4]KAG6076461.1 hypothetical protein E4U16_002753 [Claviceps sp. LM84 group G4]
MKNMNVRVEQSRSKRPNTSVLQQLGTLYIKFGHTPPPWLPILAGKEALFSVVGRAKTVPAARASMVLKVFILETLKDVRIRGQIG